MTEGRAAACWSFGEPLLVEVVGLRDPQDREVVVRIAACAVCHTDLAFIEGVWGGELPAVYGHEAAGVVEAVGPGVTHTGAGDHVVVTLVRSCGSCALCRRGLPALCERRLDLPPSPTPLQTTDGRPVVQGLRTAAFAERVLVHESQVVPVSGEIPLESAALIGCGVVTGVGAVLNTARVEAESTVGVIGTGGVGLNAVQGAVIAGASMIVAVDLATPKLEAARLFGATHTLNPAVDDVESNVAELTDGSGLDYVIVTAGSAPAVEQGLRLVGSAGAVVLVGMPGGATATIDPEQITDRGVRILGSKVGSTRTQVDVPAVVAHYEEGRLKLDELISHRFPLDQINDALAVARSGVALRSVVVF